eukprot:m.232460 g.232460  ORF g.232460 m.232460 type:complete len:396 (+) comp40081_c0_seq6:1551-2738(+)
MEPPSLDDFCVSQTRGFLPDEDPLVNLPPYYGPWTSLADQIPSLLHNTSTLRRSVCRLPLLDHTHLTKRGELHRANTILAIIAHSFIWCEGDARAPNKLPRCVAIPWAGVAERLGLPPIMTHSSGILNNWKRIDPNGPIELSNLKLISSVTGTEDEEWAFLVAIQMEMAASPGITAAVDAQNALLKGDSRAVSQRLNTIADSLAAMKRGLGRIKEKCTPDVFYNVLRPYMNGWRGNSVYPEGLIYEGVWDEPRQFNGMSGAQTSMFLFFSAALGIEYKSHDKSSAPHAAFLDDVRMYMPRKHREFLVAVAEGPSIRAYVKSSGDEDLRQAYNGALEAFTDLRSYHIQVVTSFVLLQVRKSASKEHQSIASAGTGGAGSIMSFLKYARGSMKDYKL